MRRYGNASGDSGVVAYETGPDFIFVRFQGGQVYGYFAAQAGTAHIATMQAKAVAGRGLSAYIARHAEQLRGKLRE